MNWKLNNHKLVLILIIYYSVSIRIQAQEIRGLIIDGKGEPIPYTNVVLRNASDSSFVAYCQSDISGKYRFCIKKPGSYLLECSNLSYQSTHEHFNIEPAQNLNIDIHMKSFPIQLGEVVLIKNVPVTIKKDTILFDASSFLKGNEQFVEDLLKNLPGIEINNEGVIRANGKEVEKVMVEDADLLSKGYPLLTRGMPVSAVKKVELIQKYHEHRLLKDIQQSDKVVLNLRLNDEAKRKWFGSAVGKYGPLLSYETAFNALNFAKRNSYFVTGNLNNVGYTVLKELNRISDMDDDDLSATVQDLIGFKPALPDMDESRILLNRSGITSANAIYKLNDRVNIKLSTALKCDRINFSESNLSSFSSSNLSFTNHFENNIQQSQYDGIVKLKYRNDLSPSSQLDVVSQFNARFLDGENRFSFNELPIENKIQSSKKFAFQQITYTKKFAGNRLIKFDGTYLYNQQTQFFETDSILFPFFEGDVLQQNYTGKLNRLKVTAYYARRYANRSLLELTLGSGFDETLFYNEINSAFIHNDYSVLSKNNVNYYLSDTFFSSRFLKPVNNNISFSCKLDLHQYFPAGLPEKQSIPLVMNPSLAIQGKINPRNSFFAAYQLQHTLSGIEQFYPNFALLDYNLLHKGQSNIKSLSNYAIILNYQRGDWSKAFFLNLNAFYLHNYSFYSSNYTIAPNYTISEGIYLDGQNLLTLNADADYYLELISSNIKLSFAYDFSDSKFLLNSSQLQFYEYMRFRYRVMMRSAFSGIFNFMGGTEWRQSTSLLNDHSFTYLSNNTFLDLFMIVNKLTLSIKTENYFIDRKISLKNHYHFIDLAAKYTLKSNKLSITLQANNLLNSNVYSNYLLSESFTTVSSIQLIPRIILFGVDFKF